MDTSNLRDLRDNEATCSLENLFNSIFSCCCANTANDEVFDITNSRHREVLVQFGKSQQANADKLYTGLSQHDKDLVDSLGEKDHDGSRMNV